MLIEPHNIKNHFCTAEGTNGALMGVRFGYVSGATSAEKSASLQLKHFNFLEGVPIEVSNSNLEPLYPLVILSLTVIFFCDFPEDILFSP